MEFESEGMTPPSSPIFGFSGLRDEESIIDSGIVFCFNCKGEPRRNDHSFSPESCILRREVITALEILNVDDSPPKQALDKPQLVKFFGYSFDLLDKGQLKTLIAMCRKTVASLEILSDSSHSYIPGPSGGLGFDRNINAVAADDPDQLQNQNPWMFRKSVCYFLNMTIRKIKFYRSAWEGKEFEDMFIRFRKSIGSVKDWSSVLRNHCGFRSGNECSSSTYHLFHLQLELRWSFLVIFGVSSPIVQWLLNDLINLALFKYTIESNGPSLEEKQPFNCVCVKELWTMIKLVVDELKTSEYLQQTFWELYAQAMEQASVVSKTDIFFPMWLTSNLAQINEYSVAGVYCSGRGKDESKNGNNAYKYLHSIFEEWGKRGGKSAEVLKMSFNFLRHFGEDSKTLLVLWYQWIPRLNKDNDVTCIASYARVGSWVSLISKLLENTDGCGRVEEGKSAHLSVLKDPFLEFLALLAGHAKLCSEKELKKLKSNICMKLTTTNSTNYGELGIVRVSTLFMVLMAVTVAPQEAVSTCERLQDILNYGKSPNSSARRKTILRAYSTVIILLLRKKCVIRDAKLTTLVMKEFNELLSQSSSSDAVQKELVMIYIELLEGLPKFSPKFGNTSLGRDILISPNLLMWLSNCGPNHVLRTIRVLSQISEWILTFEMSENILNQSPTCSEHKDLFFKIREKCLPFLKSCVVLSTNRIPSTDMEPLASLAADITILTRKFSAGSKTLDEIASQFDWFAMNERACPIFSQYYVSRILQNNEFVDNNFVDLRFIQCWIRLIALDVHIPNQLTERVLGASPCRLSNQSLLSEFCKKEDAWGRDDVQKIFSPLVGLVKGVVSETLFKEGQGTLKVDSENVITSVISSCSMVLCRIKFCNIYLKGDATSVGHNLLDSVVFSSWPGPPPWERLSPSIMRALEANIFDIFLAIVTYSGTYTDPYLRRKLQDLVVFSFFGFIKSSDDVDKDQHPCFKIFNYCEDNNITLVQNQILLNIVAGEHVVKDVKLSQQLVRAVGLIRCKGFATLAIRVLAGLLRVYISHSFEKIGSGQQHANIIYCCQFGTTPFYKDMVMDAFRTVFVNEKKFAFSHKRVFQLCNVIAKSDKPKARTFLKVDVIPMLEDLVESTETLRENGFDKSLRAPLTALKNELASL